MNGGKLSAAERDVLQKLIALDQGPRGCFARRETLARLLGCSLSRINHAIADLKRRRYVTVSTRSRRRDEPGIVRVTLAGRMAAKGLQSVCKQSDRYKVYSLEFRKRQTTDIQPTPYAASPQIVGIQKKSI